MSGFLSLQSREWSSDFLHNDTREYSEEEAVSDARQSQNLNIKAANVQYRKLK